MAEEVKFTPGPWTPDYDDNGFWLVVAEGMPSPYIAATGSEGDLNEANAHLIAAAPDLFHALNELVSAIDAGAVKIESPEITGQGDPEHGYEHWPWHEEWLHNAAKQSIAKARGETTAA